MTLAEIIRSNAAVHGVEWTVVWAKKRRIPADTVIYTLTGRYR